jgi:hypothetical protein
MTHEASEPNPIPYKLFLLARRWPHCWESCSVRATLWRWGRQSSTPERACGLLIPSPSGWTPGWTAVFFSLIEIERICRRCVNKGALNVALPLQNCTCWQTWLHRRNRRFQKWSVALTPFFVSFSLVFASVQLYGRCHAWFWTSEVPSRNCKQASCFQITL